MRNEKTVARRSLSEKVHEKSNSRQNRGGAGYLLLTDGVEIFKPKKEANFRFNIVPYVAGANNLATEEGELDYEFTFWVHSIDNGDSRMAIVCPKKTYGKKCPICEIVERLSKDYAENEDEIKKFKAKQRQLFNVVDARDEEQKIQIYETSYYKAFGEMLDKRLRTQDDEEDEDYSNFADIPGGRTLKVAYVEETFNNNKFYAPSSIDFIDRKEELPDDIVDHAVVLDSCLKVLSYEEIMKLLADDDIEEDEAPRRPSKAVPNAKREKDKPVKEEVKKGERDKDEGEDEEEDEKSQRRPVKEEAKDKRKRDEEEEEDEEEEKPSRRPAKELSKASSKRNEKEDDEDEDDEEEEEKPKRKPSKDEVKDKRKRDEEEEEKRKRDEEEEEKPKSKSKPESKSKSTGKCGKCPHGFSFGADCYIHEECDTCECVEECDAAQ